jgi:hypothetical protein
LAFGIDATADPDMGAQNYQRTIGHGIEALQQQ